MNPLAPTFNFRKYSLILILPLSIVILALWGLEWYFEPLDGDLTRVGHLPEKDFGWNQSQPLIAQGQLKSDALADSDVFVIGDSFSEKLLWQTRLRPKHLKHSFIHWDRFQPCENIGDALRHAGFKGRYVVIESVERNFQERMRAICKKNDDIKVDIHATPSPPADRAHSFISLIKNPNGGEWTLKVLINKIKLAYSSRPGDAITFDSARVVSLDGCHLFSNKLCNYGLFFIEDFGRPLFDSINNVLTINNSLLKAGIQPVWFIVPDKSTVYLNKKSTTTIWNSLARYPELSAPNLADMFIRQSKLIKDFYKPNDTHLSVNGYLYLGDLVAERLQ
ncbi:hypothetical protein [Methylobacter sp. YRD-M1]|uniref:hypothetical protein n=1 Tax=Methylobacter sp. YRD-M1 TaxID=2911520 RepID=UPI00227AF282|nr:hypothetical protein [Methylobacter sp. YRD-M1]WAK02137.1 hypothetical protein LZ558_20370 [Methylobacter sp. YRD-M1]